MYNFLVHLHILILKHIKNIKFDINTKYILNQHILQFFNTTCCVVNERSFLDGNREGLTKKREKEQLRIQVFATHDF